MRFFPFLLLMLTACPASAAQNAPARSAAPAAAAQPVRREGEQGKPPAKGVVGHLLELYVLQILAAMAALSAVSEAAERKNPAGSRAIRLYWNWALLAAFFACVALGFLLFFPLDKSVKDLVFRLHVWTGVIAGWAGLHHLSKRLRSILPRA